MREGNKLYVRIDYKIGEKDLSDQDFQDHLAYVKNVAGERYLMGGGFSNIDGGMILFDAGNFVEAQKIAQNDPIIVRGLYRCEIFEWELVVLSQSIGEQL